MLVDFILIFFSLIIQAVAFILPSWTVWPDSVLTALNYVTTNLASLNFILPIDTLFTVIVFLINFFAYYLTAKIILMVVNWLRGTGSGIQL